MVVRGVYNCTYMSQITIYLDEGTDRLVRRQVKGSGESASRWIAEAVRQRARTEWPAEVLAVFGTWGDDVPEGAALRKGYGKDIPRESL